MKKFLAPTLFSLAALVAGPKACNLVPEDPAPVSCEDKVSWDGRSPVNVLHAESPAQNLIDRGNVVNIGYEGHDHLAGHYSSHGSVFKAGPRLSVGDTIDYNCQTYTVYSRDAARPGQWFEFRAGLTIQYSGCGGVCLVHAG